MTIRTLTLREINRSTLTRQLLLDRAMLTLPEVLEHLVGMQAQSSSAPYVGLWTRVRGFKREDMSDLIRERVIVKATLMRGTLHAFTAADYLRFRHTLQSVLDNALESITKARDKQFDPDTVLAEGREFLSQEPRSFAEITKHFTERYPNADIGSIRYMLRTQIPLVQVPNDSIWSYPGNPKFTLAETWFGTPIPEQDALPDLIRRYLAAFGPATVKDIETWSGLRGLKETLEAMKPDLVVYKEEGGRTELLDLPNMPFPPGDMPMPPRFLPEFDNLLLSHQKRTRVLADEHRSRVYMSGNLRVANTILVDGFVAGVWKIGTVKKAAALVIEPFAPISKADRDTLTEEGEQLVRMVEEGAKSYEVRWSI